MRCTEDMKSLSVVADCWIYLMAFSSTKEIACWPMLTMQVIHPTRCNNNRSTDKTPACERKGWKLHCVSSGKTMQRNAIFSSALSSVIFSNAYDVVQELQQSTVNASQCNVRKLYGAQCNKAHFNTSRCNVRKRDAVQCKKLDAVHCS